MKTHSVLSTGFGQSLRRLALGTALVLLANLACLSHAASSSPIGQWDCISGGGGQQGIAFIEFAPYEGNGPGTLRGYELLGSVQKSASQSPRGGDNTGRNTGTSTNTPTGGTNYTVVGFTSFDGVWGYDIKGNLIGYLYFDVVDAQTGATNLNAVSFNGKVSGKAPNQRMSLVASSSFGKVTYKGLPLIAVTNASGFFDGAWYGLKQQNRQFFQELFTLTESFGDMNNIYTMNGTGPGYDYTGGHCMVSRQNRIGFAVKEFPTGETNSLNRASIGSFNKKRVTGTTKGSIYPYGTDNVIKFNATRY